MNTYNIQFYDLLSRALGGADPKRLQGFLDNVMAEKYNTLQIDGFQFADEMQLDFTYEQMQKEIGMNVMASYVDLDSDPIPVGTEGASLSTGSIPRMKMVEYYNEDKYRKMLITEQRFGADSDRVANAASKQLFRTADTLIGGHTNSLTFQRNQIVSKAKFELTLENNPGGLVNLEFAAHVPNENMTTLADKKRWWTDKDNTKEGADANPAEDMRRMVERARRKGVRGHFEVNTTYMDKILGHSKVLAVVGTSLLPAADSAAQSAFASVLPRKRKAEALAELVGAPIKEIDSLVAVRSFDKTKKKMTTKTLEAFEPGVVVFVPDGSLGEILTVEPITVAGGTYATFYEGRLLLTVGVDPVKKCQSFHTEMTSLVVPDKPQYMWYLYPYSA